VKRQTYRGLVKAGRVLKLSARQRIREPGTLRVLMYHRVTHSPARLAVTEAAFAAQQRFLAARYHVIGLEELLAHTRSGKALPPNAVLLTFDDGYRDNLELAKPILDKYGHPATVFVPTKFIGTDEPLPHDSCQSPAPTLSWDELRELAGSFSVGSHAVSHQVLSRLSLTDAAAELKFSRQTLERELGRPVTAFSYPKGSIGDFNNATQRLAARAGYELVFTTLPGINRYGFDPRLIRRHNVEDYGIDYFAALLDGSADLLALKDTRLGYWTKRLIASTRS
jgi:peptidoglycan/xylan/chitin deacetylase (PgdA/CDA1 family)